MKYKSAAHEVALCAVMTALLIAVQYLLGFVPGVELVTAFLLVFCYVCGARRGMLVATAFSFLRCFIWGFYPNVVLLYLIYFNAFALLFGAIGRKPAAVWACPVLLALIAAGCGLGAALGVPVGALYRAKLSAMLWALFGIAAGLLVLYAVLVLLGDRAGRGGRYGREAATLAALAAVCTVCFTLLDDLITPLWYGYTRDAALAYFYTGFLAMIPQTVCVSLSVLLLFHPLKRVFTAACGREKRIKMQPAVQKRASGGENAPSNDGRTGKNMV